MSAILNVGEVFLTEFVLKFSVVLHVPSLCVRSLSFYLSLCVASFSFAFFIHSFCLRDQNGLRTLRTFQSVGLVNNYFTRNIFYI
jgi:hypothetical protein